MLSGRLKSKRGISLPVAMAITSVLAILSASLIAIALSSISSTSRTVNSRQAYLNARSAIQYAYAYYNDSAIEPDQIETQYMVMKDNDGGTSSQGASIVDSKEEAEKYLTYVVATYIKPTTTKGTGGLKLVAYAKSSDSFGKSSHATKLGCLLTMNQGSVNRLTRTDVDMGTTVVDHNIVRNSITLHCKQYPGQDWTPFYYIWTYRDEARLYELSNNCYGLEAGYKDYPNNSDYHYFVRKNQNDENSELIKSTDRGGTGLTLQQAFNKNQSAANKLEPAGVWNVNSNNADDLKNGPASFFSPVSDGWYEATYYIDDDQVNYFNMIITQKGSTLNGNHGEWRPETQTSEMFHLWFLNNSDRNIYFEFLKPGLLYQPGTEWRGTESLEDRMLVYVKNKKTTVHFKVKGVGDGDEGLTTPANPPKINGVRITGSSIYDEDTSYDNFSAAGTSNYYNTNNLESQWASQFAGGQIGRTDGTQYFYGTDNNSQAVMQYEGQGWWVANIATGKSFELMLTYYDADGDDITFRVPVEPSTKDEAFIVADLDRNDIKSRKTEIQACDRIGLDPKSYTTVHVKSSEIGTAIAPYMNYFSQGVSSTARRTLQELCDATVRGYKIADYEETSFQKLQDVLVEAQELVNDDEYVANNGAAKAEEDYNKMIEKLKAAINALRTKTVGPEAYNLLKKKIKECDDIVTKQGNEVIYDVTGFASFTDENGVYKKTKALVESNEILNNTDDYNTTSVYDMIDDVDSSIAVLDGYLLNKTDLNTLLEKSKSYKGDKRYKAEFLTAFDQAWNSANQVYYNGPNQTAVNDAVTALQTAFDGLLATPDNNLDTVRLVALENLYKDLSTTQEQVDAECDKLEAAISSFTIVKPDNTMDKISSERKVRIWLKGFNIGTVYDGYDDGKGNYVKETNSFEIKSFNMTTYKNGSSTGATYGKRNFNFIDSVGLAYIDVPFDTKSKFDEVSFSVRAVQNELGGIDPSTGNYIIVSSKEQAFINLENIKFPSTKEAVIFDLANLVKGTRTETTGTTTTTTTEVEYTDLKINTAKMTTLYVDAPAGSKVKVTNPDGKTAEYDTVQETVQLGVDLDDDGNNDSKTYQVARFAFSTSQNVKQTASVVSYDAANGEMTYSKPIETQLGDQVVSLDAESKTTSNIIRIAYPLSSTNVSQDKTILTGIKFNGSDEITPVSFTGTSYVYEGQYTEGNSFAIYRKYIETVHNNSTGEDENVEKEIVTNAFNITAPGELVLKYVDGTDNKVTASYSQTKFYDVEASSTPVADILPKYITSGSGSGSGASSDIMSGLVSSSMSESLLTTPVSVSGTASQAKFDYFGQSGLQATPTKNWGQTVIWIDTENNFLRDARENKRTIFVHAWTTSGGTDLSLTGTFPGIVAYRMEDSNYYYAIVPSSCRGLIISVKYDTQVSGSFKPAGKDYYVKKIGGNPYDDNKVYTDLTDSWERHTYNGNLVSGYSKYAVPYSPAVCRLETGKQGHCCLYTLIDKEVLDGTVHSQAVIARKKDIYTYTYVGDIPGIKYESVSNYWQLKNESSCYTNDNQNRIYYYNNFSKYMWTSMNFKYRAKRSDDGPYYNYTQEEIDHSAMTGKDLRMAFVGGSNIRIQNASYYHSYGTFKWGQSQSITSEFDSEENLNWDDRLGRNTTKTDITLHNQYGGNGGNKQSMGRVGDADMTLMYDWFEYKIPVDQSDVYTFELCGLRYNPSTVGEKKWFDPDYKTDTQFYTPQIHDVYGNVWVVMGDITPTNGLLQNVNIYSQSPDDVQVEDNQDIFFLKPTDSNPVTSVTVDATGVGGSESFTMTDCGGGMLKTTIPAKKPFLVIKITYQDGTTQSYRTSLQGNDLIQFGRRYDGTYGWNNYVPYDKAVRRQLYAIQGLYYGSVIVKQYDQNGRAVNRKDGSYLYARGLYDNILNGRFDVNGVPNTSGLDLATLQRYNGAYTELYSQLAQARVYIDDGKNYPEFIHSGKPDIYDIHTIDALKNVYYTAEDRYLNSTSVAEIEAQADKLRQAISNVGISTDDRIPLLFFNTESNERTKAVYYVNYKTSADGETIKKRVVYNNTEGFPITFIQPADNEECIYDVYFEVAGTNTDNFECKHKDAIPIADGAWVYVYQPETTERLADTSYWVQNAAADYREINNTEFNQLNDDDVIAYDMIPVRKSIKESLPVASNESDSKELDYRPQTLYFRYDTKINCKDQNKSYTIKAGAYSFDNKFVITNSEISSGKTGPYVYTDTGDNGWRPRINLFSDLARAYFTENGNYYEYTHVQFKDKDDKVIKEEDAVDASTLRGWVTVDPDSNTKTITAGNHNYGGSVNLTCNNGGFNAGNARGATYYVGGKLYFRWEGNQDLIVNSNVRFYANELVFAASGTIDGTQGTYGKHFYLGTGDDQDSMVVTFPTDINVKYYDVYGDYYEFTIREGAYEISRPEGQTGYIADLFDHEYWESMKYIKVINRYSEGDNNNKKRFRDQRVYF